MSRRRAPPTPASATRRARPSRAASRHLRRLQHADGYWWGELESNATIISEHVFMLHAVRPGDDDLRRRLGNELLATQRDDGVVGELVLSGPADLSTTVEAYYALRLCGDAGRRPAHGPRAGGGPRRSAAPNGSRFFTKLWLAVMGRYPWDAPAGAAARDDPAADAGAPLALPLRLLGPGHVRGADDRAVAPAHLPPAGRPRRALHRPARARAPAGARRRPAAGPRSSPAR